jgi:hypothetical protein
MSMGNNMCRGCVPSTVMATARHPTVEAGDDEPALEEDGDSTPTDHPAVGIAHTTVVPTNFDRDA